MSRSLKEKIRRHEKFEKKTCLPFNHDHLTVKQIADRAGLSRVTVHIWLKEGLIPSPQKYRKLRKNLFRREYAETLRDCVIIRNSTIGYRTRQEFKKLAWKRLIKVL